MISKLTLLEKLKSIGNVAAVGSKEKSSVMNSFLLLDLFRCKFRSKLDAASDNSTGGSSNGRRQFLQIVSGICLAEMCCKWAAILCLCVIWEAVAEVVVLKRVGTNCGVVLEWCEVDRGS